MAMLGGEEIANPAGWLVVVSFRRAVEEHRALPRARERALPGHAHETRVPFEGERDLVGELDDRLRLRYRFEALRGRLGAREREAAPVQFTSNLRRISCEDGSQLRFHAEAERSRSDNLLALKSQYNTAPFGSFVGVLPGGVALAHGLGVVEHHRALW